MVSSTRSEVLVRCGISVVKKRNTTSVVWDYFGLRANPDGSVVQGEANYPMCRSRVKSVPAKGGNTTNLLTHLRDHHPDLYAEASMKVAKKSATTASSANENRQPTLLQSIKQNAKYGAHSRDRPIGLVERGRRPISNSCSPWADIFVCVWYKCAIRENLQQS